MSRGKEAERRKVETARKDRVLMRQIKEAIKPHPDPKPDPKDPKGAA